MEKQGKLYDPTICVTHSCNLNCVYCYQKHKDSVSMDFDTAKLCVDKIFQTYNRDIYSGILLKFMGGEPLMEFDLLKQIYEYVHERYSDTKQQMERC